MSITVLCPKGHRLVANDNHAGKTGRCPVCQATVSIPLPRTDFLSETAIMGILGSPAPKKSGFSEEHGEVATMTAHPAQKTQQQPQVKMCLSCDREIDTGYHICPHCHTYISTLSDF
jgi:RNA polymerase subunit RPABC4/transcription elongation factor Spt4